MHFKNDIALQPLLFQTKIRIKRTRKVKTRTDMMRRNETDEMMIEEGTDMMRETGGHVMTTGQDLMLQLGEQHHLI